MISGFRIPALLIATCGLVGGGCGTRITGAPAELVLDATPGPGGDAAALDAAAPLGAWGPPAKIGVASTTANEDDSTMSSSTLELFFAIDMGANGKDLYYTSRATPTSAWTTPVPLAFNSATQSDETPRLSADDRTLYYASGRAGNGTLDIFSVTRAAPGSTTWSNPVLVAVSTTTLTEKWYMPCGTNHYVMVQNHTATGADLMEGTVGGLPPVAIAELNSAQNETGAFVTADCLTVYFASNRSGPSVLYTAHRAQLTAPFSPPTAVVDFALAGGNGNQEDPWMSPDGRTFTFASDASGTKDVYLSTR